MQKIFLKFTLYTALVFLQPLFCEDFENIPKMTIRGEGVLIKPSDQVEVDLGVITHSENSSEAVNANNIKMRQIIENLKNIGLEESEIQTGRFTIKPIYPTDPINHLEDRSKIRSYEVVNSIAIKTLKISLIEKILSEAVKEGANQVREINFNLNNPETFQNEVIALATQKALTNAQSLANASGVRLVKILSLSLEQWQNRMQSQQISGKMFQSSIQNTIPIESGNTEIRAVVNVVFEIKMEEHSDQLRD